MVKTKYKERHERKSRAGISAYESGALMIAGAFIVLLTTWARLILGYYGVGLALVGIGYAIGIFTGGGLAHEEEVE
jgi:hypothetical protein